MTAGHHILPPRSTLSPVVFLLVVILSGCSVGQYLSAYFNTYFNASRLFEEAEAEILSQHDLTRNDTTYLRPYKTQGATKTKLTSVIEKCSKILQYDSESSLVDDALLMIGKSYSYQNEQQRAERKFLELINGYPESSLVPEAEILLAETYYRMKETDKAVAAALILADSTGGDNEWVAARAFVLIGQVEYERGNYAEARQAYRFASEFGAESDERAQSFMRVADMSVRMGDLEGALEAYENAEDESSAYAREFRARMGQIDVLTEQEEYAEALDLLDDIRENNNFSEYFPEVDLAIAHTLKADGRLREATDQYYWVDSTYQRTPSSAQSHLSLGRIYETEIGDYDSALAVYTRGRTQSPQDPATPIMIRRGENLRQYVRYRSEIARLESLKVEVLLRKDSPEELPLVESMIDSSVDSIASVPPTPLPSLDSLESALARNMADLGGLFYVGMEVEDSTRFWYGRVLSEYPGSPFSPKALYTLAQIEESQGGSRRTVDSLYAVIVEQYPETLFAEEARRLLGYQPVETTDDPALRLYEEAEVLLELGATDDALEVFRRIVNDYPESGVAPKAQFAIAWTYDQVQARPDSAVRNFKKLVHLYPTSSYATVAFTRLNNLSPEEVQRLEQGPNSREDSDSLLVVDPSLEEELPAPDDSLDTSDPGGQ